LASLPGVAVAACAVQRSEAGNPVLIGYVVLEGGVHEVDRALLAQRLPAAMVPRIVVLDDLPTRTSGKIDRNALPWPVDLPEQAPLDGTAGWVAEQWRAVLGLPVGEDDDFFAAGGASLAATKLVSLLRKRCPALSVNDVYRCPTLGAMAERVDELTTTPTATRSVHPVPRRAGIVQMLITLALQTFMAARWLVVLATLNDIATALFGPQPWAPRLAWPVVIAGWLVPITLPGRLLVTVGAVRLLTAKITPGRYRRGRSVHLRLWTAERLVVMNGIAVVAGSHWSVRLARALGCEVGKDVLLHTTPPLTGLASFGDGAVVEPEADIAGVWVDGDEVEVGTDHHRRRRPDRHPQHATARRCRAGRGRGGGRNRRGRNRADRARARRLAETPDAAMRLAKAAVHGRSARARPVAGHRRRSRSRAHRRVRRWRKHLEPGSARRRRCRRASHDREPAVLFPARRRTDQARRARATTRSSPR
jgi:hypothetical protein